MFSYANANDIRVLSSRGNNDPAYHYLIALTRLALSKNEHLYPKAKLVTIGREEVIGKSSTLSMLEHGYVDILWSGYTTEIASHYLPIHISLFRGLLGYRVSLIRQEDKDKFLNIKAPSELKKLVACQGSHWPDSDILESYGYSVLRVNDFNTMFKLLAKKRCDYFPRSIFEGYTEQKAAKKKFPNIVLLDELILHYDFPFYYFVNQNNTELAERIEKGLLAAVADGSFMALMKTHEVSKHLFPLSQWKSKRFFELPQNSLDSAQLKNKQLWINLQQ